MAGEAIVEELLASGVRGRGGAGFPMGRKASFIPKPGESPKPIYLTVNADESEPGTFKDRELMLRIPHAVIEGIVITCHAIGADTAFIYLRGEYLEEFDVMAAALEEAKAAGYVGTNVAGSDTSVTIVIHRGAGAYICGEETALLESLEGKRGQPRSKPPFPAISGVYASPTLINNVETIATVPTVIEHGRREVRGARRRELRGDAALLALGERRERRELRARAGHAAARRSSTTSAAASRTGARSRRSSRAGRRSR